MQLETGIIGNLTITFHNFFQWILTIQQNIKVFRERKNR